MRIPSVRLSSPTTALCLAVAWLTGMGLAHAAAGAPERRGPRTGKPPSTAPAATATRGTAVSIGEKPWTRETPLAAGETLEVSVQLTTPSRLPENARIEATWELMRADRASDVAAASAAPSAERLDVALPNAGWRKLLHALDGGVFVWYRAPVTGRYRLRLAPIEVDAAPATPRWREKGTAPDLFPLPVRTPWPAGAVAPAMVDIRKVDLGTDEASRQAQTLIEAEPNDSPELAQPLTLRPPDGEDPVRTYEITGTSDDVDFFDNRQVGASGDDWYRVTLQGSKRQLVTAQISMPGQFLASRVRCYELQAGTGPVVPLGRLVTVKEFFGKPATRPVYTEGKRIEIAEGPDPNERAHQQEESHRANISRILEPGKTYYFRVEANSPAYQFQIRVLDPAPYSDPRLAIRQAMYTHIGQVDSWLTNRPRGASIERRIRDSGNLLGTQCMSCHTQSGVWGPAVAISNGYRIENVQNYWHLLNVMYECLRPTNELKDAANNTSLAPLDIGDGPAGTRAAGFNIINAERNFTPRKLHGSQQIRTANYVLQTADPGGINAAGPGSNVGQNIVWLFTGEILKRAWEKTGDPRYFRAMEDRARKVLGLSPRYTDDVAVRVDFFTRLFDLDRYPEQAARAAAAEKGARPVPAEEPTHFVERARRQLREDEARLRAIQTPDGGWGFDPGNTPDGGKTWRPAGTDWDPSPTALAIQALSGLGYGTNDPAVARAVKWLLANQDANGRWNKAAITGFVPTAYVLQALGRLYPVKPVKFDPAAFRISGADPLPTQVRKAQEAALSGDPQFLPNHLAAARSPHTAVRYWGLIGLGAGRHASGLPVLIAALGDPARPVRDAAVWGVRQSLLDDRGWAEALAAYDRGSDVVRESVMIALNMRADAVMPAAGVDWARLGRSFDRAMNDDPHPAVRAWATKAAWQWWVWNPPIRGAVNGAWVRMLERPEPNALVENSNRYSSQALFIVNGHKANASDRHQYKELAPLFETLRGRLETAGPAQKDLLARRLVGVAATFYQTSGGDGGPGQLGYSTPGAGALLGQAVLVYLRGLIDTPQVARIRTGLEGAANIPHRPLQEMLVNYALNAPDELREVAAAAVSDPRSATLQAAVELVEPLIQQVRRGAAEPPRRASLSEPVIKVFSTVAWVIPKDAEQQRHFLDLIVPKLADYHSPAEIAAAEAARRAAMEKEMEAAWYLADRLGQVVASNPDLHFDMVFRQYFPDQIANPLQRHFWVRSVPWLLEFKLLWRRRGHPRRRFEPDVGLGKRWSVDALAAQQFGHCEELKSRMLPPGRRIDPRVRRLRSHGARRLLNRDEDSNGRVVAFDHAS